MTDVETLPKMIQIDLFRIATTAMRIGLVTIGIHTPHTSKMPIGSVKVGLGKN